MKEITENNKEVKEITEITAEVPVKETFAQKWARKAEVRRQKRIAKREARPEAVNRVIDIATGMGIMTVAVLTGCTVKAVKDNKRANESAVAEAEAALIEGIENAMEDPAFEAEEEFIPELEVVVE